MASIEETQQILLDAIATNASQMGASESASRVVLNLAEAHAWLQSPSQPHGGNAVTKS